MRFVLGVAVGAALGFLLAYELFGSREVPSRRTTPVAPVAATPAAPAAKAPEPPQARGAEAHRGPLVIRHSGGSVTTTGDLVIIPDGEVLGAGTRTVEELRAALAEARTAADWALYFRALSELGAMGTPEAQALLVEVMGDDTLTFVGPWTGQHFLRWLEGSDAPGLLEAARRRAEIDIADNPDSRWKGVGWLSLVARRGGPGEIAWIESLGGSRNRDMEVDRALAEGAKNPLAAERLAARLKEKDHYLWSPYLSSFAKENPRAAFEAAVAALPEGRDRRSDELVELIGEAATADTLDRARTALLKIGDPFVRLDAVRAVERMRKRGLDVAGFAPLSVEARVMLERSASKPLAGSEKAVVRRTLEAIAAAPWTWDDGTRLAVRAFLDNADRRIAAAASEAMARMEGGPGGGPDGWQPERGSE